MHDPDDENRLANRLPTHQYSFDELRRAHSLSEILHEYYISEAAESHSTKYQSGSENCALLNIINFITVLPQCIQL